MKPLRIILITLIVVLLAIPAVAMAAAQVKSMLTIPPDTIYIGDSMVQYWHTGDGILNAGRGGDSSGDVLFRWRENFWGRNYQSALVWTGFGDIHAGISPAVYHDNVLQLLWSLRQRQVKSIVVMGLGPAKPSFNISDERIRAENAWLATLDKSPQCPICTFVPVYDMLRDPQTGLLQSQYDSGDGLHLSAAAYAAIEKLLSSSAK